MIFLTSEMAGNSSYLENVLEEGSNASRRQPSLNERVAKIELSVDKLLAMMGAKFGDSNQQTQLQTSSPKGVRREEDVETQPDRRRLKSKIVANPISEDDEGNYHSSERESLGTQNRRGGSQQTLRTQMRPRVDHGRRGYYDRDDDYEDDGYLTDRSLQRRDRHYYRQRQPNKPKMEFSIFERGDPGEWIS